MALIFDIKHFAIHDGDGIRTTIFFKGCPLRCRWCHNPEGIKCGIEKFDVKRVFDGKEICITETVGRIVSSDELISEILKDQIFYNNSHGGGVTISGGEPFMQTDALLELLLKCKDAAIHTAVDTSGYASVSDFKRVVESKSVDLFLFDIKVIDSILHKDVTGCDNEPILENLEILIKSGIRTILRLPMIPQVSFTKLNIKKLISFLDNIKSSNITELTLLPYHNTANAKYARFHYQCAMSDQIKSLDPSELTELQILLENRGWKVSIG